MRLHGTQRWRRIARHQLREHPLCAMCLLQGEIVPASVADHIEPHHNDTNKFWLGELRSLCTSCHSGFKQQMEKNGKALIIGFDGWPVDYSIEDYSATTEKKTPTDI